MMHTMKLPPISVQNHAMIISKLSHINVTKITKLFYWYSALAHERGQTSTEKKNENKRKTEQNRTKQRTSATCAGELEKKETEMVWCQMPPEKTKTH